MIQPPSGTSDDLFDAAASPTSAISDPVSGSLLVSYARPQSRGLVAFRLNTSDLHRLDLILQDPGLRYQNATDSVAGSLSPTTDAVTWASAGPNSILGMAPGWSGLAPTIRISSEDLRRFQILLGDQNLSWNAERAVYQAGRLFDALDPMVEARMPEDTASLVLAAINHRFHTRRSSQA